jgi:hypothetical protein
MSYLHPPKLIINIKGTHREETYDDNAKDYKKGNIPDFSFPLDASAWIEPDFYRIAAIPKSGKSQQSIKETMLEYALSRNMLKEIHLQKQVLWNFGELRTAIEWTIRSAGYKHDVHIDFRISGHEVHAYSSSMISKISRNVFVQCCCIWSCLCIIFAPIYLATRKTQQNK